MAKSTKPLPPSPREVSPKQGIALLLQRIEKGKALLSARPLSSDDYSTWQLLTKNYLEKAFGKDSSNVTSVTSAGEYGAFPMNAGEHWWENHRAETLTTKMTRLEGLIELLSTEMELESGPGIEEPSLDPGHRIFLVHGHDDRALHEVARFLERLQQEVIVLREQPNSGRTIIEKFVDYSHVGYAIILLTPDDRGGAATARIEDQLPRARQNVIFELGYFLGKLTRNRVTALYVKGVEIPSDYSGVAFVELDDRGAWRLEVARELKAAGFALDMNLAV
jgi:hypothetical protein